MPRLCCDDMRLESTLSHEFDDEESIHFCRCLNCSTRWLVEFIETILDEGYCNYHRTNLYSYQYGIDMYEVLKGEHFHVHRDFEKIQTGAENCLILDGTRERLTADGYFWVGQSERIHGFGDLTAAVILEHCSIHRHCPNEDIPFPEGQLSVLTSPEKHIDP